jgi:dienelactone hydrolase
VRVLEFVLAIADLVVLLGWRRESLADAAWFRLLPPLAGANLIAHLLIEKYRLQVAPLYLVTLCIVAVGVLRYFRTVEIPLPLTLAAVAGVLGSMAAAWLIPVFQLPQPSGPYSIGTLIYHVTGPSSHPGTGEHEFMAQVWYPSDMPLAGRGVSYRPYPRNLLPWKTQHLALVETHAAASVSLSSHQPQFPVLVFSPSWSGERGQNMVLVENLVSHGFIVVGIDHPHSTEVVVFPDGRVVREDPDPGEDYASEAVFQAFLAAGEKRLRARMEDVELLLNTLEDWQRHDPRGILTGRMDLDRIGIFGHSFGGAVAAETCLLDRRVKAGVDMDGLVFGRAAVEGVDRPFLFFAEDFPSPSPTAPRNSSEGRMAVVSAIQSNAIRRTFARGGGYFIRIRGAYHRNYSDSPLFSRFRFLTHSGPIDPLRAFDIVNDYVLNFFQHTLLGLPAPLLEGPSPQYPEVTIRVSSAGVQSAL